MGRMKSVGIYATTENFDHVLELIEEWHEIDMPVHILFPKLKSRPLVGNDENHLFYGTDVEACYQVRYVAGRSSWHITRTLRRLIADLLEGPGITTG